MTSLGRPLDLRYRSNRLVLILSCVAAIGAAIPFVVWEFSFVALDRVLGSFLFVFLAWAIGREYDPDRPATANLSAGIVVAGLLLSLFILSEALTPWLAPAFRGSLEIPMTIRAAALFLGLTLMRSVIGSASSRSTMPDRVVIHVLVLVGICALYLYGIAEYFSNGLSDQSLGFFSTQGALWFLFLGAGLVQLWLCYVLWLNQKSAAMSAVIVRAICATVAILGLSALIAFGSGLLGSLFEHRGQVRLVAMIHLGGLVVLIPWLLTLRPEAIRSVSDIEGDPLDPRRVVAGRAMLPMVAAFAGTLFLLVVPIMAAIHRLAVPDPEPEGPISA